MAFFSRIQWPGGQNTVALCPEYCALVARIQWPSGKNLVTWWPESIGLVTRTHWVDGQNKEARWPYSELGTSCWWQELGCLLAIIKWFGDENTVPDGQNTVPGVQNTETW